MMLFAEFVYSQLSQLGDTHRYLETSPFFNASIFYSSTSMMEFTGSLVKYLQPPMYHLPAMVISFCGFVLVFNYFKSIGVFRSTNILILFVLANLMPSYLLWTSVHSKEAISVFIMSFFAVFLIKYERSEIKGKDWFAFIIFMYLGLVFKAQYFAAIISCLVFIYLYKKLNCKALGKLMLFTLMIGTQVLILFGLSDIIDAVTLNMYQHFDPENARSTRENIYFVNEGDFFRNMFSNMLLAAWGPTLAEVASKPLMALFFLESLCIALIIIILLFGMFKQLLNYQLNISVLVLSFLMIFWLLLVHYPFGIFNPGSAIRYRQNFYPLLITLLFYLNFKTSNK
ncbi:hypothetical protein CWB73_02130 [Pseudoalteromonas phenolica]|uniref:Glycosyltransferase RgtA/B/C/D-like domain-containing protein n=2 Tax=Pseudoalteromonas phenolica TaxID=161398 RepID=A0A5S3YY85_9GAMM|nr:hypothetical protein CWB73_02130 [Pseudoalteromonas phenolica]